jgi:transcriptional regulator with XRE-family HTH domain
VRRVVHDRRRPARDLAEAQLAGLVETLREARVDLGLSPERLGLLAGLSDGSVRMWETGKRQPGFAEVVMWAGALGFEVRIGPAGNMGED